jgi:leucyl-tRNA synthetase
MRIFDFLLVIDYAVRVMYQHRDIDKKWQKRWQDEAVFKALDPQETQKEPFYCLVEFPFPSGAGLHVGHPRSYTALDVIARKKRAEGKNVLYPIGWDAFGLPTENFAIKTGRRPEEVTRENIDNFRRQLQSLGLSFDWEREVDTTDPNYYKWTQWMFQEFFKAGLAYKEKSEINWCPSCKIGLANEEVVANSCERCGGAVVKKEKEQWMIEITRYADRLIDGLMDLDFPEKVKKQQIDWVGRKEGAEIDFGVVGSEEKITVFTTRPDTVFGVTYVVLAPEHSLVEKIVTEDRKFAVEEYLKLMSGKSEEDRMNEASEKTGVFTGAFALNPVNGEEVPIWIGDYVLAKFGTGAVMAVPAHDERDFAFAKKCSLPVKQVVDFDNSEMPFVGDGIVSNSGKFNGLTSEEARVEIVKYLAENNFGQAKKTYRLRDWVFSRQRYWGEPIPLVYSEELKKEVEAAIRLGETEKYELGEIRNPGWTCVLASDLPVKLPEVEAYEPTDDGESPLAKIEDWVKTTCPRTGAVARRETDTMPNWAGSSWYFLRYLDTDNDNQFASAEKLNYWMPVNWYNGGMEHTTLHLLYSRFWTQFLHDRGHLNFSEPYARRTSHGLILAEDGNKMSKSKGNVVNPDEIVQEFGADTLRVYELFIGPFSEPVPWSQNGVIGVRRFLDKVLRLDDFLSEDEPDKILRARHRMVKMVLEAIEEMRFNVAVSELMKFTNEVVAEKVITRESLLAFAKVLNYFAPHVSNELAEKLGFSSLLESEDLPDFDESLVKEDRVMIAIQVNGKLRGSIEINAEMAKEDIIELAKNEENVKKYLVGEIKKEIFVPGKLVNFVV